MQNTKMKLDRSIAAVCIFILTFFIVFSRRQDILLHAQPWAEDGVIWMKGIYEGGFWNSIFYPANGYYQTISRITYGIGLLFGLSKAPLVANIIAILIRCFFVLYVLSDRMKFIALRYRVLFVLYFLLMPNIAEAYVNVTNAHWYLSLYLLLVVISDDASTTSWKVHDFILLIISSLSGPFVIFIAPCLILKRISQNNGLKNAILNIKPFDIFMAACCLIQIAAILTSADGSRSHAPLGASFSVLSNLISYRIVGGSIFDNGMISSMALMTPLNICIFIFLVIVTLTLFVKEGWRFKSAVIFPTLMIGFALAKPMMSLDLPQWPTFLIPGGGERYFIITNIAFFSLIIFICSKLDKHTRNLSILLPVALIVLMIPSYSIKGLPDVGYQEDVAKFETLPSGESMKIRINPNPWGVELTKK
jgi:hypothetical protein